MAELSYTCSFENNMQLIFSSNRLRKVYVHIFMLTKREAYSRHFFRPPGHPANNFKTTVGI